MRKEIRRLHPQTNLRILRDKYTKKKELKRRSGQIDFEQLKANVPNRHF